MAASINPRAADGKPFVLPNIFPGEVILNFVGCSDALAPPQRLGGAAFQLEQLGIGDALFSVDMLDGCFLAGGHITWQGGSLGSYVDMRLVAPASTVKEPTIAGAGNCNLVATGLGFDAVVPAAGDGVWDVDAPVPIPATDDETNAQNGLWDYSEPWIGKGTTTPGTPGSAKYNLFNTQLTLARFVRTPLLLDTGARDLIAPAIKPKWVLPEWKMQVTLHNASVVKTLVLAWDMLIARRKTV